MVASDMGVNYLRPVPSLIEPKPLSELLASFDVDQENSIGLSMGEREDALCYGIQCDSRAVKDGDLFLAVPGEQYDGSHFCQQAVERGAVAIITESGCKTPLPVPVIQLPQLREKMGTIAALFYQHPAADLDLVAVTGTNGKTSVTHYIAELCSQLGISAAVVGTLGWGKIDQLYHSPLTTPDAVPLQGILAHLRDSQTQCVALEASSIALEQQRLNDVAYKAALLTNATSDHLDYHGSQANYIETKRRLFTQQFLPIALLNIDDPLGAELATSLPPETRCWCWSLTQPTADIYIKDVKASHEQYAITLGTPKGERLMFTASDSPILLTNILAALTVIETLYEKLDQALEAVANLTTVRGRMEWISSKNPQVVVDFAHNSAALETVLNQLKPQVTSGKLWVIFGCGGDRDADKRPLMGEVAEKYADRVVVTSDNNRFEYFEDICADILKGFKSPDKVMVESDRAIAIKETIKEVDDDDCVLIAGKGHEDYQEIAGMRRYFNDSEQAKQALAVRRQGTH